MEVKLSINKKVRRIIKKSGGSVVDGGCGDKMIVAKFNRARGLIKSYYRLMAYNEQQLEDGNDEPIKNVDTCNFNIALHISNHGKNLPEQSHADFKVKVFLS